MAVCAKCGNENSDGARFCSSCGAAMDGEEASRDVRKVVTVLFCDLAGYTSTGDRLDPEALRSLQSRYFDEARAALERHGGTVEKFIGDAVMAVFGIPTLHEDDALRALRAALDLRAAVTALSFQARIGINTGEVVAGTGDALVTGDAVNVAARLEQAAQPGEILLGEGTHALTRDASEVEPVEPVEAKGKPEPVPAFRLVSVKEGAEAIARQLDAPLVGRREEIEAARRAFAEAVDERRGRLFTVFGPPGIGKSRLALELAHELADDADVLAGRCLPYGESITYWPFVEIFREAGAEDELAAALAAGAPEDVFWALRKALEQRARARPLMLVIEDIHWAESTMLDLIEHLCEWTRDAPLFLLCLSRPELLDERQGWPGGSVRLEPLSAVEIDELMSELLGDSSLDAEAHARIRAASEGNPLYVEQLVAMLAEGGDPERIPPTIQALLAARLDALPEEERELLERASVIGHDFEWEALGRLTLDNARPSGALLSSLVRKELIRPHDAIEDSFRFRHVLIRDAAYERIPKAVRAELHERCAGWLGGRGEEFDEVVGHHLEQAYRWLGELGPETERGRELAAGAARHLGSSGRRAYDRGDLSAAADLLGRAVRLSPDDDPSRLRLLPMLGRALTDRGEWKRAKALLGEAIETGKACGELAVAADATVADLYLWLHTDPQASHQAMRPPLEEAIRVFESTGELVGLGNAIYLAGQMRFWRGDALGAIGDLERAADYARDAGDRTLEAEIFRSVLVAARNGPTTVADMEDLVDDLRRRVPGSRRLEMSGLATRADAAAMRDDFDTAFDLIAEADLLAEELGTPGPAAVAADVSLLAGDGVEAERRLRAELDALERIGDWGHYVSLVAPFVDALVLQGRGAEAQRAVDLAAGSTIEDDLDGVIGLRCSQAALLLLDGDVVTAEARAREGVSISARSDFSRARMRALSALAEILCVTDRQREARGVLEEAIALAEQKGSIAHVRIHRAALESLAAQPPATA